MAGNADRYADIYREMTELIGEAAVHKIWRTYGGLSITFPTKLYSKAYVRRFIEEHLDEMRPAEMARELKLSDRRVRQIIREIRAAQAEESTEDSMGDS